MKLNSKRKGNLIINGLLRNLVAQEPESGLLAAGIQPMSSTRVLLGNCHFFWDPVEGAKAGFRLIRVYMFMYIELYNI